ncbi:MAG: glycosyltransferase family 2 protein [Pyrinomonadaceae bacterium]|nr:glycosyltransferase family 2 protein [Pyrinomonadaceae bacterium]
MPEAEASPRDGLSDHVPAVSVIIPYYNTAQYIGETLDSLFAQTYTDYEVILINDGSPDTEELERVLDPYRARVIYLEQENRGSSSARNTGLRVARGRFVALLDSDDLWHPEYLSVQVATLEDDPTVDVIFPNAMLFGDSLLAGKTFMDVCPVEGEITFANLITQQCNVWVGVTARREIIMRAGMFDESLGSAEDLDLWLRILHQGGRITYHRRVLGYYRQRRGSHTSKPIWLLNNWLKLLDKVERTMNLSPAEREATEQKRAEMHALLRLCEGKKAFFLGDKKGAIEGLSEANLFLKSRKISLSVIAMRLAPRLLRCAYNMRDKFLFRADTKS